MVTNGRGLLAVIYLAALYPQAPESAWPQVASIEKSYTFKSADTALVEMYIPGLDGRPVYRLRCQGIKVRGDNYDYSGDFECRLTSFPAKEAEGSLLLEADATKPWESRGRFLSDELVEGCANYPDFGRRRVFKLRGMALTLEVRNPAFRTARRTGDTTESTLLDSFDFHVQVRSDASAKSSVVEPSPFLGPPYLYPNRDDGTRDCKRVRRKG